MKFTILTINILMLSILSYSQTKIELTYDPDKKNIIEKTECTGLKVGESYFVKINGVNSSFFNAKLTTKTYHLSSNTLSVIQPLFPGIPDASVVKIGFAIDTSITLNQNNAIYDIAKYNYEKLQVLKSISDTLYAKTKNTPDEQLSTIAINETMDILEKRTDEALKKETELLINQILYAKDLYKIKMEISKIDDILNEEMVIKYSELMYMSEQLAKKNYLRYIDFIVSSQRSKAFFKSKSFIAKKDIVNLNVLFVDSYSSDTLINTDLLFYTKQAFSFDFSSGFFYNDLIENSYYLTKRDSTTKNVLEEDNISFDVAFGALGHFSYKITNSFKAGLSMGAAISPLDGKVRYLLGASILFGRKNQIGINGGLCLAKFKVLSESVQHDEYGYYVSSDVTVVPTYDKLNKGYYIGITYNLTAKKK